MSTGSRRKNKIRVAFFLLDSFNWKGGFYYIKNLLYALSIIDDQCIEPVFIVGLKTDPEIVAQLAQFSEIIYSPLSDRHSISWFVWKIIYKLTGSNFVIKPFLKKHKIGAVSHSNITNRGLPCKTINWIPDFQHVHLPEMFSKNELQSRDSNFKKLLKNSDLLIVSSYTAKNDAEELLPSDNAPVEVLQFVSNIDNSCYDDTDYWDKLREKYSIDRKFFYLPNQFWKHKNHEVVFKAIDLLKSSGSELLVYCSGPLDDYRNKDHIKTLTDFIAANGLEKNIILLGNIDRKDVFYLMRYSVAVINPSLFEGWSSTVEEAKSMGKIVVLSDIEVHKEQDPPENVYFPSCDSNKLSEILHELWVGSEGGPSLHLEKQAKQLLPNRIKEFGEKYQRIVLDCL